MNTNRILMQKYKQYLMPSILTTLALALNEFVDCMIVSNLLGSDALAVANLGCPVILLIAAGYVLFGNGGAILYAIFLGKWDRDSAGKIFRLSMILSGLVGFLFLFLGMLLSTPFTKLLCPDESLLSGFQTYYQVLLFTAPVLMLSLTFVSFLPPSGAPMIASVFNLVANGTNLVMDIVYIKVFGMGIEGAGYATITGYVIGFFVMLILMRIRGVKPVSKKLTKQDIPMSLKIMIQGLPAAMLQICFAIKYAFSNNMAGFYGGRDGVVAFSLCLQTFSIASIFLLGVADTAQPLLAMLYGQQDYVGERSVLRKSMRLQVVFAVGLILFFEIVPQAVAAMYGVTDPEVLRIGNTGIRIFALTYLPRGIAIQFMRFFQVEQRRKYAFLISLMDGLLVLPVGIVLCSFLELNGVYAAYPAAALIMLALIFCMNYRILRKEPDSYVGISLIRKDTSSLGTHTFTITDASEDISKASEQMIDFCTEKGVPPKQAFRVGLLIEEMAVYTRQHRTDKGDIDINLRLTDKEIAINFRSIGTPFDPTKDKEGDIPENMLMLKNMASKISYDYVMGMNNTQILIERS